MIDIREAKITDIDEIMEINLSSFSHPYNEELLTKAIESDSIMMYVACIDGEVVGYLECIYMFVEMEISSLAVRKDYRRKGIASLMIDTVMADMSELGVEDVFLEVRSKNTAAKELYANSGFRRVAIRKGYYKKPLDDAFVLHYRISEEGRPC